MKIKNKTTGEIKTVYGAARGEYYTQNINGGMTLTEGPMFLVWDKYDTWRWVVAADFVPYEED